ncbi:ATP-binding cassette domain-containing protein [Mycoplasmatota bacterium]|nr:ATP-binding cassette domain-containing protein [Mycoplasmatota bacterium]
MIEIGINQLRKFYGANKIFENVSFELQTNDIIGLIGQNGTGKTTLMKVLMGEENAEGDIFIRKGIKLSYLHQIPIYDKNDSVIDILYKAFINIQLLKKEMSKLEKEMAILKDNELDKIMNQYSQMQTEFDILGGYEIEEKLGKIVTGLQLEKFINMPFNTLSGGEKTRVMLGKVLLENPDVLLLDEPTNHLDIKMVSWLEGYLTRYKLTAIIISHDRYFLDKVVNKIIELHSKGIEVYHGNYSYYKVEKVKRYEALMKEFQNQQKKINNMEEQIKRYRIWGKMRDSDKMYRKAKELEKRLTKIDKLDKPNKDKVIKMNFDQQHRSSKRVYELKNISKSYQNKPVFSDLNLEIFYQDTLTIIGDNGSGKSTLLKIMMQEISPDQGTVQVGSRVKVGYLPQEIIFNDESLTILETYQKFFECTTLKARNALAGVLFTKEDVFKKINVLSGGEKIRLKLLMLMDQQVNVLLLDEPTNHLDIDSREILENSLLSFKGTLIVISHDRYLINKLSNRIAEIENNRLKVYEGDFDSYLIEKQKERDKQKEAVNKEKMKRSFKKKTEKINKQDNISEEKILEEIEKKENQITDIIHQMNLNYRDGVRLKELNNEKDELEKEIEELYECLEN